MDYNAWIRYGMEQGWASPAVCSTHDGIPSTLEEDYEFEEGDDPCIHVVRLYESITTKRLVEENFAPAVWRKAA